jgi:hypothetical protein
MRGLDAISRAAVVAVVCVGAHAAYGQQMQLPAQQQPTMTPGANPTHGDDNDPAMHDMIVKQVRERNALRQQNIQKDTDRLLLLAQQLKAEVDKSNKNMLSVGVVKKAEEIEKLAKTVKEKMRDGQ